MFNKQKLLREVLLVLQSTKAVVVYCFSCSTLCIKLRERVQAQSHTATITVTTITTSNITTIITATTTIITTTAVNKMACLLTVVVSAWLHSPLGVSQTLFW